MILDHSVLMLLQVLEDIVACDLVLGLQRDESFSLGDVLGSQVRHFTLSLLLLMDLGPSLARLLLIRRVLLAVFGLVLLDLLNKLLKILEVSGGLGSIRKSIQLLLCILFGLYGVIQQLIDFCFAMHELIQDKRQCTDSKALHLLEISCKISYGLVVILLVRLEFPKFQIFQFFLQVLQLCLFCDQISLDVSQAFTAYECSIDDLELASNLLLQLLGHSLALSIVHAIKFLLLLPEVLEGLLDFFIEVIVILDLAFGVIAVYLFIEKQLLNFYLIVPTCDLFLQGFLVGVVVDNAINVIKMAVDGLELGLQVTEEGVVVDWMLFGLLVPD